MTSRRNYLIMVKYYYQAHLAKDADQVLNRLDESYGRYGEKRTIVISIFIQS